MKKVNLTTVRICIVIYQFIAATLGVFLARMYDGGFTFFYTLWLLFTGSIGLVVQTMATWIDQLEKEHAQARNPAAEEPKDGIPAEES